MREKKPKHVQGIADKPTTNGHYMGRNYGFDYEDGKYKLAPCVHRSMDEFLEKKRGLKHFMAVQNQYFGEQFKILSRQEQEWWGRTLEEYGLEGKYFSYRDGWLIPLAEEDRTPMPCAFCGEQYRAGEEALAHRIACLKDPFAILYRELKKTDVKSEREIANG